MNLRVSVRRFLAASAFASINAYADAPPCPAPLATPAELAATDLFGVSVDSADDVLVVGARGDDDSIQNGGAAYVYRRVGVEWSIEGKLTAPDAGSSDDFGISVATDGQRIVVGASRDDDRGSQSGSAYVYAYNGSSWEFEAKLVGSDIAAEANFGRAVTISGNMIVVGATENLQDLSPGSAYVFEYVGGAWNEMQRLIGGDFGADDRFGVAVAIRGEDIFVGARSHGAGGAERGAAYVFTRGDATWFETQKLTASDLMDEAFFGFSIAVEGDTLLIGANGWTGRIGAAYVFRENAGVWSEQTRLNASDGAALDEFGYSVDLNNGVALIGAPFHAHAGVVTGAGFAFREVTGVWTETAELLATAAMNDSVGNAVAIADGFGALAAPGDDTHGMSAGACWLFAGVDGADCDDDNVADACAVLGGATDFNLNAKPDTCECIGDLDNSGLVDIGDLSAVLASFGRCEGDSLFNPLADIRPDGCVDLVDLGGILSRYANTCP